MKTLMNHNSLVYSLIGVSVALLLFFALTPVSRLNADIVDDAARSQGGVNFVGTTLTNSTQSDKKILKDTNTVVTPTNTNVKLNTSSETSKQINSGQTNTFNAVIENIGGLPAAIVVDLELKDSSGKKVDQKFFENQTISSSNTQSYSMTINPNIPAGTYRFSVGLFQKNWSSLITWYEGVQTFTIGSPTPNYNALNPYIILSTYNGYPGASITVKGFGFAPSEAVKTTLQENSVTGQTDESGNYTGTMTIPNKPAGSYNLNISGVSSGKSLNAGFYISGYYPVVKASKYYLLPGYKVSFTGTGFAPNEFVGLYDANGTLVTKYQADQNGNFSAPNAFEIPNLEIGTAITQRFEGLSSKVPFYLRSTIGEVDPCLYALTFPSSKPIDKGCYMGVCTRPQPPTKEEKLRTYCANRNTKSE